MTALQDGTRGSQRRERLQDRLRALPPVVPVVLGLWLATRAATALATWAASELLPGRRADQVPGFVERWTRWDVDLFRKVAEHGYTGFPADYPDRGIEAVFPGYPLVLRLVGLVVPSWTVAGLLVSLVGGAVAVVALARLAALEGAPGERAVLVLLLSPYAVFLAAAYSEALFLALALPGWVAARQGRWAAASVLVALATTVRITGLFLAVALVVEHLVRRRGRPDRSTAWLALPFAALAGYWGYLWALTGDPLRWFSAQREGWERRLTAPHDALRATLRLAADPAVRSDYGFSFAAEVVAVAVGVGLAVVLLRRRRWSEATYVGLSVGALATSTFYLSVDRATLLWFPLWLLLAEVSARRHWVLPAYLTLSAPLSLVLAVAFTSDRWVG
ncbi:MAG: hypothetical protein M3P93_15670 [Actinomycetota bacterium]|nr:hypothetical protein [Actinomycetota bacterium]